MHEVEIQSLNHAIQRYGAKGAVLQYISSALPDIPIPPFICVSVDEDWRVYRKDVEGLGRRRLVRSSSPLEDGLGRSLAGLFPTCQHWHDEDVERVIAGASDEEVVAYTAPRGITLDNRMGLIFQTQSLSHMNWSMARHPHNDAIWFFMGRIREREGVGSFDYIFDASSASFFDATRPYRGTLDISEAEAARLEQARRTFEMIESLPAFQTGYVYQMEFGTSPFALYQFRSFRKREPPTWSVRDLPEQEGLPIRKVVFGITPKEGAVFDIVRLPDYAKVTRVLKDAASWSDVEFDANFATQAGFASSEQSYVQHLRRIPSGERNAGGWNPALADAYCSAVADLVKPLGSRACIFQENIHSYYATDVDVIAPAAGAWVTPCGANFLSHKWFRPVQGYPLVVLDGNPGVVTGDRTHIFSDGQEALIVKE